MQLRDEAPPSNVVDLAAYRRSRRSVASKIRKIHSASGTTLKLEITADGCVVRHPIEINPAHALAVLAWCAELSARALDIHTAAL